MRPIYKNDAQFPDAWPGVVLTKEDEQHLLNAAVESLSSDDATQSAIKLMLMVTVRFDPNIEDRSSQEAMDLAWRMTGGDTDPHIFPDGRPLDASRTDMALEALGVYMQSGTDDSPEATQVLISNISGAFDKSTFGQNRPDQRS